jgi:hypothetical protein
VCIDIFGYDVFAAEACFNLGVTTMSMCACATISHSHEAHTHVHNLVSRHIHAAARSGAIQIAGFPKFDTMIDTLKSQTAPLDLKLSVTTLLPCGALVINDALCTKFSMNEWTKEACHLDVCVVVCDCRIIKGPYLLSVFKGQVAVWKPGAPRPTKTHVQNNIGSFAVQPKAARQEKHYVLENVWFCGRGTPGLQKTTWPPKAVSGSIWFYTSPT